MTTVEEVAVTIAAIAAGLAGLGYIGGRLWKLLRSIQGIHDLIERELSQNGGGSMRDEVAAIAVAVGTLQGEVEDLATRKEDEHKRLVTEHEALVALVHQLHRHDPQLPELSTRERNPDHGPDAPVVYPPPGTP